VTTKKKSITEMYIPTGPVAAVFDSERTVFLAARARTRPQVKPDVIHAVVVPRIVRRMAPPFAPRARRIAISPVRCETKQEMTLYNPAAAIATARSAKAPRIKTSNLGSVTEFEMNSSIVETPKTAWSEFEY
jgi:hypothetical protein